MSLARSKTLRPATFAGRSYLASSSSLARHLTSFFEHADGAGVPAASPTRGPAEFRGILSPHIDFFRGGPTYSWAYRELVERSDADLFVIIGVCHASCRHRFVLSRMDFDTPFGPVSTDREFVDRLVAMTGRQLLDDELQIAEHSVEFQAVLLHHVLGGRRPFSIVPILAGSFHDLMRRGVDPIEDLEVRQFIEALRSAERASGKKVAYIGGIDLCHVGPEFGDRMPVDDATLARVEQFDERMLDRALAQDARGWFQTASSVNNRYRVCGLSATYTMLHAMGPARGRLLRYQQAVDDARTCCVSFASVVFEDAEPRSPSPIEKVKERG